MYRWLRYERGDATTAMDSCQLTLLLAPGCSPILPREDLELVLPPTSGVGLTVSALWSGCREHVRKVLEPNPTIRIYRPVNYLTVSFPSSLIYNRLICR